MEISIVSLVSKLYSREYVRVHPDLLLTLLPAHSLILTYGDRIISIQQSQHHGCWYPASLRRQGIGTHDIDFVAQLSSCLKGDQILATFVISVSGSYAKKNPMQKKSILITANTYMSIYIRC